tara:strand:- start:564 stop:1091 length:528 start_codon:yes stop_codon:yes gene_type:complete
VSNIILVSGGVKSGKSEFAEFLACKDKDVTYIALSENHSNDKSWENRIKIHQLRRPKNWNLIETENLIPIIQQDKGLLLIDSLGGFIVYSLKMKEDEWIEYLKDFMHYLCSYKSKIIIVAEQTGWGLVSEYEIGNIYNDRLGTTLKEITKISKQNWLTINGKAIKLDNIFYEIPK